MSKSIVIRRHGGPEVLVAEERPAPAPGPGQVRIRVHVAGVNDPDLLIRAGRIPLPLPLAPGFEVAGEVDAVGAGVELPVGTRVATMLVAGGGYAQHVPADAAELVPIPPGVDDDAAVAALVRGSTALLLIRVGARLQPGETLVVPAAAGGVGSFTVQLARRLGAGRVIAAASSDAKRAVARELGADAVVDPARADLGDELRRLTGGRGVDVVLAMDPHALEPGLAALAPCGRLVLFGADVSLAPPTLDAAQVAELLRRSASVGGFAVMQTAAPLRHAALSELFSAISRGELRPLVRDRFALVDAAAAHRALESRATVGNVVLEAR